MGYQNSSDKKKPLTYFLVSAIGVYKRFISPVLPYCCRYHPSCSEYTVRAIEKYGPLKGSLMGVKRIVKCNPLFKGGYDPVN